jgi:DNA-binding Lrp family transcriptional regulator
MNVRKVDEIDKKILFLLSENARISYVDIGKEVNLSRVAVKSRIDNLEENGIIEKYTIDMNLRKVGREVAVFFDIEAEPGKLYEIGKTLSEKDNVTDIYQMTGTGNLHMHALLNKDDELNAFLENELYSIDGVLKVTSRIILTRFKARTGRKL